MSLEQENSSWEKIAAMYRDHPGRREKAVIGKFTSALTRGILVALLIAMPALILPDVTSDAIHIVMLLSLFAGTLVFFEYLSTYPSIVEFSYAPPFNRLRFLTLFLCVLSLSLIVRGQYEPNALTSFLRSLGIVVGDWISFPYSPVNFIAIILPDNASYELSLSVRIAAGIACFISFLTLTVFFFYVRILGWPARNGAFNVWLNLPLFDPTSGGDVQPRLQRDGRLNIVFGFLMPFLMPAVFQMVSDLINPIYLDDPITLVWTISAWAFIPISLIMRGMTMVRVAQMIDENRRRAYADALSMQTV